MSSVITTRMFGRPSRVGVDGPRGGAGGAGQGDRDRRQRPRSRARRAHAMLHAIRSSPRELPVAQRNTVCHTVSTMPMTSAATADQDAQPARAARRAAQRIVDAATELVRERSYAELSVGEVMERAGLGRTIFYRHFDDLGDLLMQRGREAIEELYAAQATLAATRDERRARGGPGGDRAGGRRLPPPRPAAARGRRGGGRRRAGRRRPGTRSGAASTSWSPARCASCEARRGAARRPRRDRAGAEPAERELPARRLRARAAGQPARPRSRP